MKQCIRCGKTKPLNEFNKAKRYKDGHHYYCKACVSERYHDLVTRRKAAMQTAVPPPMKQCQRCSKEKPLTEFHRWAVSIDGRVAVCIECRRAEYPEKGRVYSQQRYQDNKDAIQSQHREWKRNNREHKRQTDKAYRARNKEDLATYNRAWWEKNKAHANTRAKRYLNHKRTYRYKRESLLKQNGGSHTWQEWADLCDCYDYRCLRCGIQRPIDGLSADHVIPITKGGTNDISNLQPLCWRCNSRKKTKTTDYRPVVAVVWPLLRLLGVS